jgi:hypothetical protein
MMRRVLVALAAILLVLGVGATSKADATPAGYFYLPSGSSFTFTVASSCTVTAYHGNFGNVAYAKLVLGNNCSQWSQVRAQAWGDQSSFCSGLGRNGNHPADCSYPESNSIQAVAVGTLIGSIFRVCVGPDIYPPCYDIAFSPIP